MVCDDHFSAPQLSLSSLILGVNETWRLLPKWAFELDKDVQLIPILLVFIGLWHVTGLFIYQTKKACGIYLTLPSYTWGVVQESDR